ncbi:RNA-binding protein CP33, chloroplastic [Linum perenne]
MAALSMAACFSFASSPLRATKASNLLFFTYNPSTTTNFRLTPFHFHLLRKPLKLTSHLHLPQSRRYLAAADSENLELAEDGILSYEYDGSTAETEEEDANGGIPAESSDAGRLYVGNLSYTMTSEELTEIFAEAGRVSGVEIIYDRVTDRSRGFGFITMATVEEAKTAIKMFNDSQIGGRRVRVNFPEVPKGGENEIVRTRVRRKYQGFIDSPHKVYAGNLGWTVTSEVLKQAFAGQPGYLSAKVSYERDTGRSRGFGFVSFETAEDAEAALNTMNGVEVEGRPLRVNTATPPKTSSSTGSESSPATEPNSSELVSSISS